MQIYDIALYLLIININIYTLFYMCFFPTNYSMGKISKKNNEDPSKEVQWTSVMNSALVDAFLHQVNIVGRVNGTFTSKAYDDIVKELVDRFLIEINNDNVKNLQKNTEKKIKKKNNS